MLWKDREDMISRRLPGHSSIESVNNYKSHISKIRYRKIFKLAHTKTIAISNNYLNFPISNKSKKEAYIQIDQNCQMHPKCKNHKCQKYQKVKLALRKVQNLTLFIQISRNKKNKQNKINCKRVKNYNFKLKG